MTSATRALSAAVEAMGFSQNVGMPRSTAASVSSAWAGVAAATTTPSTPEDSSSSTVVDGLGAVLGGDGLGDVAALVGDHQPVETRQAAEGFGVEGADAAQSDYAEGGHGILRSILCCECDVELLRGEAVGQGGQHGVDLARRGQAADRLVLVEVGGERVALGGGVHRIERARDPSGRPPSWPAAPGRSPAPSRCGPSTPSRARTARRSAAGWPSGGCRSTCWRPPRA